MLKKRLLKDLMEKIMENSNGKDYRKIIQKRW